MNRLIRTVGSSAAALAVMLLVGRGELTGSAMVAGFIAAGGVWFVIVFAQGGWK
jgi:hypothetical protein